VRFISKHYAVIRIELIALEKQKKEATISEASFEIKVGWLMP
jgi:hypothetical protein